MAIKNYGFPSGEAADLTPYLTSFNVSCGFEGPQALLEWEFVDDSLIKEFKIRKKEGAYPLVASDGILVVHNKVSGAFGDLDINDGTIYYYTMFIRPLSDLIYRFSELSMGKVLALQTGYYEREFWKELPQLYRIRDNIFMKALIKTSV